MSGLIIAPEKGNVLQVENLEPLQENRLPEGRTGENYTLADTPLEDRDNRPKGP